MSCRTSLSTPLTVSVPQATNSLRTVVPFVVNNTTPDGGYVFAVSADTNIEISFPGYVTQFDQDAPLQVAVTVRFANALAPTVFVTSTPINALLDTTDTVTVTPKLNALVTPGTYIVQAVVTAGATGNEWAAAGQLNIFTIRAST